MDDGWTEGGQLKGMKLLIRRMDKRMDWRNDLQGQI
jgi:hypothetical protein